MTLCWTQDLHGSDRRQLSNWCVLAVSSSAETVYQRSAFARGKVQNVELVRPKDMVVFVNVDPDGLPQDVANIDRERRLSVADRHRQRGTNAAMMILQSVLSGVQFGPEAAICVVEWHANFVADWNRAVRQLQNKILSGNCPAELPSRVWALGFADSEEEACFLSNRLREEMYSAWFSGEIALPDVGKVGPKELPHEEFPPVVPQPELKIGFIGVNEAGMEVLALPDMIGHKFESSVELSNRWQVFRDAHVQKFGKAKAAMDSKARRQAAPTGPDFTLQPPPPPVAPTVIAESHKKVADIEPDRVFSFKLAHKALKIHVHVCKNPHGMFEMWLDGTQLDKDAMVPALEMLMGFGLGKWAAGDDVSGVKFHLGSDLDFLTIKGEEGSRKTARLCEHLGDIHNLGKEGKLAYHLMAPMANQTTGKLVAGRFTVQLSKKTAFVPKQIDIKDRLAANKPVVAAEAGACFFPDQLCNLPTSTAAIVFDCNLVPGGAGAEVVIRPSQPKLLLTQDIIVPKGAVVKVL